MSAVVLSGIAENDLTDIWVFIAHDSSKAADRQIDQIYEKCRFLAGTPGAAVARPELERSIRSLAIGSYLIFYREPATGIEVARVLHGRRDIRSIFNP